MARDTNELIERLPSRGRARLLAVCEEVVLVQGRILGERGESTRHVYFPLDSSISLVAEVEQHPGVEVAMVGSEGMIGAHLVLGVRTAPLRSLVQGAGTAWCVGAVAFDRALAADGALRRCIALYLYVLMDQLAVAVACRRFHLIGPRLARWLLMSQDRAHADRFHVTHEFLAAMLGVRRVGVTVAAGQMQEGGLIAYHRGMLTVLDRPQLQALACSCYASDLEAYRERLA